MFFLVPLIVVLLSLLAIGLIAWRKLPYLRKLSEPTDTPSEFYTLSGFVADFFPEIFYRCRKIDFSAYKDSLLKEFEKLLRRLRVISLKIDQFTNNLLRKIKSENLKNGNVSTVEFKAEPRQPNATKLRPAERLKREEQLLVMEIAKNPKNPELYKKLADIYIALKNFSDARESLEAALELDPEDEKTKEKLETIKKMLPM